jgi:aminoglycoside 3-N-acetyltransferase I
MTLELKKLNSQDLPQFKELLHLFEEVFEMGATPLPDDGYLNRLLSKETFMAFVAVMDQQVVGGLTVYTMEQYHEAGTLAYIHDLAVKTEFQRKGIGKRLLESLSDHCRTIGINQIFVQADDTDAHALEFYQSTGGEEGRAVGFYYHLEVAKDNH